MSQKTAGFAERPETNESARFAPIVVELFVVFSAGPLIDQSIQFAGNPVPRVCVLFDPGHDRLLLHSGDYKENSAVSGPVPVD